MTGRVGAGDLAPGRGSGEQQAGQCNAMRVRIEVPFLADRCPIRGIEVKLDHSHELSLP